MDLRLIYALVLTIMPVTELRIGLPLAITYALENDIPVFLIFFLILFVNILIIFFVFYFLDNLHKVLMNWKFYKRIFTRYMKRFQKRIDKFEKRHEKLGFVALVLFVAVPLPGTGAWSGVLVAWLLGLDRKKSIISIALGILIAGLIILFATLGIISFFS